MTANYYGRSFFERAPDDVARDLIGSLMIVRSKQRNLVARIVETEAYGGSDDPASHAYRGSTPRCAVMFGPAGVLYVYRSYGVHWCMNIVTGPEGLASAVLLRAAEVHVDEERSPASVATTVLLSGPGNLTRGLGITGADDGADVCDVSRGTVTFQRARRPVGPGQIGQTERVGITKGADRLSRFLLIDHPAVSPMRRRTGGVAAAKPSP
jgi:DNA-3-methyladenine glycosylase